jgi:hypothetical protein
MVLAASVSEFLRNTPGSTVEAKDVFMAQRCASQAMKVDVSIRKIKTYNYILRLSRWIGRGAFSSPSLAANTLVVEAHAFQRRRIDVVFLVRLPSTRYTDPTQNNA